MKTQTPQKEYEPFGDEWKKEVAACQKPAIVELYRRALMREQWSPVEYPPDDEMTVLVGFADGEVELGYIEAGDWRSFEGCIYPEPPVAWRELPEVPAYFLPGAKA
jgi:hypothetical protein